MRLSQAGELSLLENIRSRFAGKSRNVLTGIGDDSAVLRPCSGELLATSDYMLEGVHFDLRHMTPLQLGFKLVSVNVSDIYAMGGSPRHMLVSIAAPADTKMSFMDGLFDGIEAAIGFYGMSLVGGDVSASKSHVVLSATALGCARKAVRRSGARPGDLIYVSGNLGDSACGLELLRQIRKTVDLEQPINKPLKWGVMGPLLKRHLMPEARRPGAFAGRATSMIDISDGLFIDLGRLCAESGVGARIFEKSIPMSRQLRAAASSLDLDPLSLATTGGEDYELLFTAPPRRKISAIRIGEVTQSGMVMVDRRGEETAIAPEGYTHFA
jgi:thiamine-monophosphate kinase